MSSSSSTSEPLKLLVAVDFGTTFSGVAYLQTKDSKNHTIIQDWGQGSTGDKVPTILKYDDGDSSSPRWGFHVRDDEENKVEWFKLGLYPLVEETDLARKYQSRHPRISQAQCEKHVVNYLTALRKHVDSYLKDRFTEAVWRSTPIEYIITVPACWPPKSQDITLACADKAGMGPRNKIQIVAEPEAAGIYALQRMQNINLNVHDTFVICDAGGGTVDLISYTVKSLKPIPAIDEEVEGVGALCGGSFLNRIFEDYLEKKFKNHYEWKKDPGYQADAVKEFEANIKKSFDGNLNTIYTIRVKGLDDDASLGIKNGLLQIPGKDIETVFDPVMREIVKLVKAQIKATKKPVKAVLLAGGFGRNDYLRNRIKKAVAAQGIHVLKVENSNTAIVRGALIHGLAEKVPKLATFLVDARIARQHYGTRCWLPLTSKYDASKSRTRKVDGKTHIDVIKWFLHKNQAAQESKSKPFPFIIDQPVDEGKLQPVDFDIYICEDPKNVGPPDYPGDPAAHVVMKLKANFSNVPREKLTQERSDEDGRWYYKEVVQIEMSLKSARLIFTLNIKGEKYHSMEMEFV